MIYADDATFSVCTRAAAGRLFPEPYMVIIDGADERLAMRVPALANIATLIATLAPGRVEILADPADDPAEVAALRRVCAGESLH